LPSVTLLESRRVTAGGAHPLVDSSTTGAVTLAPPGATPSVAPQVEITAPAASATVSGTSLSVTTSVTQGDNPISSVAFYVNAVLQSTDSTIPYTATVNTENYPDGDLTIRAVITDNQGLTGEDTVIVSNDNGGEEPPPSEDIDIFMSLSGSDGAAGTEGAPVRTLERAIALCPNNGIIGVVGGNYIATEYQRGTTKTLTVQPVNPASPPVFTRIELESGPDVTYDGLQNTNGTDAGIKMGYHYARDGSKTTFKFCGPRQMVDGQNGWVFDGTSFDRLWLEDCVIGPSWNRDNWQIKQSGSTSDPPRNMKVERCHILYANEPDGSATHTDAAQWGSMNGLILRDCVFEGGREQGVFVGRWYVNGVSVLTDWHFERVVVGPCPNGTNSFKLCCIGVLAGEDVGLTLIDCWSDEGHDLGSTPAVVDEQTRSFIRPETGESWTTFKARYISTIGYTGPLAASALNPE
jgi:hypothetical protein